MKNILKRCFSVFLAITIIFSSALVGLNELDFTGLFAVEAEAADEEQLTFELNDDNVSYSVSGNSAITGEVVIPDTYNYLPVTDIADYAFMGCTGLTSITIPDSITNIGDNAFYNCESLENIVIPDSVTDIGVHAFYDCENLSSVTIGESVKNIGDGAFYNCKNIASIVIPDSVTYIGGATFRECTSLENVVIGNNVENIYSATFYYCTNLSSVTLGSSIKTIGDNAFYYCQGISTVLIPDGVQAIGNWAFLCCTNLFSITIPDSVTTIGKEAFYDTAYYNDENNWEDGVLYIGNHLVKANGAETTGLYTIRPRTLSIAAEAFYNCGEITSIFIPDSVKEIGDFAFADCTSLSEVTIPDSVTRVGESAFYYCTKLTAVTIGRGVKYISYNTFEDCYSLTSITIPDSVTSIGALAFWDCGNLTSITIPDSVNSIDVSAFYGTAYYNEDSNWENNVLYIGNHLISAKRSSEGALLSGDFEIKPGTKTIACQALYYCKEVTSVIIPDSVTHIGDEAFSGCKNIKSIIIPDSVVYMGSNVFEACSGLEEVIIGSGIENIKERSFSNCSGLKTISFLGSVNVIGEYAFSDCANLESVYITDLAAWCGMDCYDYISSPMVYADNLYVNGELLTEFVIPEGVTKISCYALNCKNLMYVTIPSSVTCIEDDAFGNYGTLRVVDISDVAAWCNIDFGNINAKPLQYAFYLFVNGEWVTDIVIPDGVTRIPEYAFYCVNLESITIPSSVTCIESNVFNGYGELKSVYISDIASWCNIDFVGYDSNPLCYADYLYINGDLATDVIIPEGVTKIPGYAFSCKNIESITIPASVNTIEGLAFDGCENLDAVYISDLASWCKIKFWYYSNPLYYAGNLYINGELATDIVVPESVTSISDYTFAGCTSLSSLTLHDGVTSLGEGFISNTGITSFTVPNGITKLVSYSFIDCTNLVSLTIPKSVKNIDEYAFGSCFNLEDVYFIGSEKEWSKINIARDGNYNLLNANIHFLCDHPSTKWVTEKKATVNSAGKKVKKCTECGEVLDTAKISQLKCGKPTLKSIENTEHGVLIKWGKVSGADKYDVYRKTSSSGKYSKIATTSNTYYTDKKASSGKKYYYYVKAVNEAGSSSASSSKSIYHLADTTLETPSSTKDGIKLKWSKITGAEGYKVYRKTGSGSYSCIATVKGSTKVAYTDKSAKKGKTYTYKIKVYKSKTYSAYSNAKKIKDKY